MNKYQSFKIVSRIFKKLLKLFLLHVYVVWCVCYCVCSGFFH
jgi:hypothetical protein